MRRATGMMAIAVLTAGLCPALLTGAGTAAAADSASGWGAAREVPGTAALNAGGFAEINAVSCASAGNCSAGGYYFDSSGNSQAFVVSEVRGRWSKAEEVPGTAVLNAGGSASVASVSCAAAGNCVAGGYYRDSSGHLQVFVVTETKGRWRKPIEVPGTAALNTDGFAEINAVSCAAAGDCAAGGYYTDGSDHVQAYVVTETKGQWRKAVEVPGTAALNVDGNAAISSLSCASAGNCVAGGNYRDSSGHLRPFVVTEAKGRWRKAGQVRGVPPGNATITSLSCANAGNCAVGGNYVDGLDHFQVFVVTEAKGRWRKAVEVPGTAALNKGGDAELASVSCAATGDCVAGGSYLDGSNHDQAFVVTETKGRWRKAVEVPGTAALNKSGDAELTSVSCAATGDCAAGGSYQDGSNLEQAFVVTEAKGRWRKAIEVPGTAVLNAGGLADIYSVSCGAAGVCAAGGSYEDSSNHQQAFLVTSS